MIKLKKLLLTLVVSIFLFGNCTYHNEADYFKEATNTCVTENISFQTDIYPIITNSCLGCHNNSGASGSINLEGYDNVKKNSEIMMKTIKHVSGVEPMPQNATKLADCPISKLDAWIDQGMKNN